MIAAPGERWSLNFPNDPLPVYTPTVPTQKERANVDLVLKVEEAWNSGDLACLDELFTPDAVGHASVPGLPEGLAGWKLAHTNMMRALPDRFVYVTNLGGLSWAGVPANGRRVDIPVISIYRVAGGKIAEHWAINDLLGLLQQVGARREVVGGRVMKGAWPVLA